MGDGIFKFVVEFLRCCVLGRRVGVGRVCLDPGQ